MESLCFFVEKFSLCARVSHRSYVEFVSVKKFPSFSFFEILHYALDCPLFPVLSVGRTQRRRIVCTYNTISYLLLSHRERYCDNISFHRAVVPGTNSYIYRIYISILSSLYLYIFLFFYLYLSVFIFITQRKHICTTYIFIFFIYIII